MARITPLAEAAAQQPVTAVFAAGGLIVFLFCLIAASAHLERWIAARQDRLVASLRWHARRIRRALGSNGRRMDDWADEIAPRPGGRT